MTSKKLFLYVSNYEKQNKTDILKINHPIQMF
jgi:hypothetical protein